jgi:hypothetical protein
MRTGTLLRETRAEAGRDWPTYLLVAAYAAMTLACGFGLDRMDRIHLLEYAGLRLWNVAIVMPTIVFVAFGLYVFWTRAEKPFELARTMLLARVDARLLAGVPLLGALMIFMGAFTSLKNVMSTFGGFKYDAALAELDRALHGVDPWRLFPDALLHPLALRVIEINYQAVWMVYVLSVAGSVALFAHDARLRTRFMICYVAVWGGLGNGLAAAVISAGPAYYGQVAGDPERFRPLLDRLAATADLPHSAGGYQEYLWTLYEHGATALGSGISAFPSVHVAMAALYCFFAYELNRRLGHAALAYLVVTLLSSVLLGWHYAMDGYASIAAVIVIHFGVRAAMAAWPRRSAEPALAPAA